MYIPTATYRVQLHKGFNFLQLREILPYLYELGISTIYASPVTQAIPGSGHGYDVTDPLEINPEIGTLEQWEEITAFLKTHGMGWLQDIVPNHMAYSTANPWLYDVLERGACSDFYSYFDIIPQHLLRNPLYASETGHKTRKQQIPSTIHHILSTKPMVPFLEKDLQDCLRTGEIKLTFTGDGFSFCYKDQRYPAAVSSYYWICASIPGCYQPLLAWSAKARDFAFLPWQKWARFRKRIIGEVWNDLRLRELALGYCTHINTQPGLLEELLSFQHYQLCGWKMSFVKMNYRRFFAVNSLICLRMQDDAVFQGWHALMLSLYNQGMIQGFRIDHIDGLADPGAYLQKLRHLTGPDAYIISEKILQENEETIPEWPVQGTTGYDFLSFVNQLLTNHAGKQKLVAWFREQIRDTSYTDLVYDKKYSFLKSHLGGELNNLLRWLIPLAAARKPAPALNEIKEALAVLMAAFPVYRIYPERLPLAARDLVWIREAFAGAEKRAPHLRETMNWLRPLFEADEGDDMAADILYFLQRWAQYTAPLAAKGTEDTVFYNYNALIGHNEVGDSPDHTPVTPEIFHQLMENRFQHASLSLNGSSSHDTKRGEDNRLRINLISLFADEWIALVEKWRRINQPFLSNQNNRRCPSLNDEYLIYQALAGAIPEDCRISIPFRKRFDNYLIKTLREEKDATNWENPDAEYEKGCIDFVNQILSPAGEFLTTFLPFANTILREAFVFSLSQTLIKLTAPGIPDIYQGAELWDFSLVDPDNRLPVNFDMRMSLLNEIILQEKENPDAVLDFVRARQTAGAQKIFLIRRILHFRKKFPELFSRGQYLPVITSENMIGYIRGLENRRLLVLTPLPAMQAEMQLHKVYGIRGRWKNIFTGSQMVLDDAIDVQLMLKEFPVAALVFEND
jgi:(1->4)-alpha-D-glucan 1-alpha-D-glucosylmutase